jgi:hypothetical protein
MARSNVLVKVVVGLVVLAGLGFLFVRSAQQTQSEPYTVRRENLREWTLAFAPESSSTGAALMLQSSPELLKELFRQVFTRSGISLSGPSEAEVPLVLRSEFDRAFAARTTPDALMAAARNAGLDALMLEPRCLAARRVSAPGVTDEVFFVLFDVPAFARFREQIGTLVDGAAPGGSYDPAALSPVLIVAASDSSFGRWLPLHADPTADCRAPILVASP